MEELMLKKNKRMEGNYKINYNCWEREGVKAFGTGKKLL